MTPDKWRLGSMYSGCGGFDLGFKQAGFELAWANDIDPDACETYRKKVLPGFPWVTPVRNWPGRGLDRHRRSGWLS